MSLRSSAAAQSVISLETARAADRDPAGSKGEPNLSDQYRILALMIDRMQRRIVDMLRLELGRIRGS
jgi:hypothetical protein